MQVEIERLGHLGDGIAAGPVYVARTLPGEIVEGEVEGDRIVSPRILKASPERVSAPCRHYRGCGGCALQHARDEFVSEWKIGVVRAALDAVGLQAPVRNIHTSPSQSRRRATFSGRRTKSGATVGFHAPASDVIRDVPDCLLVRPALRGVMPFLSELVSLGGSRKGEVRMTVTETDGGMDVAVTGGKPLEIGLSVELSRLAEEAGFARITWDGELVAMSRAPAVFFGRTRVTPPPGSFLQATEQGQAALVGGVQAALENTRGPILDLFAGCGTFALPIAETRPVHAVEGDAEMLAALSEGWRYGQGLQAVSTETRDLFRRPLTPDEINRFGGVVIDPPRAGAERQVVEIAASKIECIAFVSCNPVTFARDVAILAGAGFTLAWLDVVDQFRWSTHVEIVAMLQRR